jgi:hypothetical protein
MNFLLETLWTSSESVVGEHKALRSQDLYVSPGIRWVHNLNGEPQIVPGIAAPIGNRSVRGGEARYLLSQLRASTCARAFARAKRKIKA